MPANACIKGEVCHTPKERRRSAHCACDTPCGLWRCLHITVITLAEICPLVSAIPVIRPYYTALTLHKSVS